MAYRRVIVAALAVASISGIAQVAHGEVLASFKPAATPPSFQEGVSTYRAYVNAQAASLVGMTRVLTREVKDGNLDAAQSSYAPAHRYLKRIEPIVVMLRDLHTSLDAKADAYAQAEGDPSFSGFHRLEHGLFAKRSTADLSAYADRLFRDTRYLRERVTLVDVTPSMMVDAVAQVARSVADKALAGDEERYSRTDLWDLEANIDGVQEIVTVLQPPLQAQHAPIFARAAAHLAQFNELLARQKDGCGFKNYEDVSKEDKAALKASVAALAADLSTLRGELTVD